HYIRFFGILLTGHGCMLKLFIVYIYLGSLITQPFSESQIEEYNNPLFTFIITIYKCIRNIAHSSAFIS
ncbi:hypothetical protein ACJX0J_006069, partial [Zea mays]